MNSDRHSIGIIIQARMGSTRLPGKVMKKIGGKTIIECIFYRLSFLKRSATAVLATSDSPKDDILENFCRKNSIRYFRGSENNVLERYYLCAKEHAFSDIVRLTADNPFTDIEELDNMIDLHIRTGSDYTNSLGCLPVGVGAEIFTMAALEKSYAEGKAPQHIEHVDEYILENPGLFKCAFLKTPAGKDRHDISLTIDTEEDYRMACKIAEICGNDCMSTQKIVMTADKLMAGERL